MKTKDHYEDEILSKLKSLEEEYDLMMYFNNLPSDISTISGEWVKRRTSAENKKDDEI